MRLEDYHRRRLRLPDLLEEALSSCQDDQPGLNDSEEASMNELVALLREHRVTTVRGLRIRLNRERRVR